MDDLFDRRSHKRLRAQLEAASKVGGWMPWTGSLLALSLWAGVAAWLYVSMGPQQLVATPPLMLAGGALLFLTPGIALIAAGFMARESRRSSEANALVLASARLLLEPADSTHEEISSIAETIVKETQILNKALSDTRTRMDGLRKDIDTSVTSALKAAEIVRTDSEVLLSRMKAERESMLGLSVSLQQQAEGFSKTIPRHAQLMSEAARAAQEEVRKADETLDSRLKGLEDTARRLAERITQLDTMGAESRKRVQTLATTLTRLDEQLVQSTRMVDAAMHAGELATVASKNTADSLRDAVSDALASAMKASEMISHTSSSASESAREAMERLKEAGLQAESTTRAATLAARAQADQTEQRINALSEHLYRATTRVTGAAEAGLERARTRIEKASLLLNQMRDDPELAAIEEMQAQQQQPAALKAAPAVSAAPSRPATPMGALPPDIAIPPLPAAPPIQPPPAPAVAQERPAPPRPKPTASADIGAVQREAPDAPASQLANGSAANGAENGHNDASQPGLWRGAAQRTASGLSWRDLLTGIDEPEDAAEQAASAVIDRLDRAGVRLSVVNAADLRRIASASHQGERQRRRAIRDLAPVEIQRVARLLDADVDLQAAAKTFIASEEPMALQALSTAEQQRDNPGPRLSAYLFLDAAMGG
jgi:hypothetical protein